MAAVPSNNWAYGSALFTPEQRCDQIAHLRDRLSAVEEARAHALATNASLIGQAASAEAAKSAAERRLAIAKGCVEAMRKKPTGSKATMADDAYDREVALQEEISELKKERANLRKDKESLRKACAGKDEDLKAERASLAQQEKASRALRHDLAAEKEKAQQQQSDAADIRANLDNAYADLRLKEDEHRALRKHNADLQADLHGAKLQLQDATKHFQDSQRRVDELESQKSAIEALEQDNATLQADVDTMQSALDEQARDILVKDTRIAHLEDLCQKALAAKARAEEQANDARDPAHETPASVDIPPKTLDEELDDASDLSDPEQLFQPTPDADDLSAYDASLELVPAVTTADTAPVDASTQTHVLTAAPQLSIDAITTTADIVPVDLLPKTLTEPDIRAIWQNKLEPVLRQLSTAPSNYTVDFIVEKVADLKASARTTASTQTEEEEKPTIALSTAGTQTDAPQLAHSGTSAVLDVPPIVHEEQHTQTDTPQLAHSGTSTVLDFPPVEHKERHAQTDMPQLAHSGTSTVADFPPIEHEERHAQTDLPQLTESGTSTILDLPPTDHEERHTQTEAPRTITTDQVTQTVPHPSPRDGSSAPKKRGYFTLSTAMAIFFALIAFFLYAELESWKMSSSRTGLQRLYNSRGYQQRGRHILGTIPVCYEQGDTWLTEAMCQQFTGGVQAMEAWLGIRYPKTW